MAEGVGGGQSYLSRERRGDIVRRQGTVTIAEGETLSGPFIMEFATGGLLVQLPTIDAAESQNVVVKGASNPELSVAEGQAFSIFTPAIAFRALDNSEFFYAISRLRTHWVGDSPGAISLPGTGRVCWAYSGLFFLR